jgi:hypothetical protein
MRYLILTYYKKPNGQIDEATAVAKNIRHKDLQMANVILDFKNLAVLKCTMDGTIVPKDWDKIVAYYYQHYPAIIERLFKENGYELKVEEPAPADPS